MRHRTGDGRFIARSPSIARVMSASPFPTKDPVTNTSKFEHKLRQLTRSFGVRVAIVWLFIFLCGGTGLSLIRLNGGFIGEWWRFIVYGEGTPDVWKVGLITTLFISVISITLAVLLAFLSALGRLSRNPIAYGISTFYVSLIRGTPLIVQIFILYFGLPQINQQLAKLIPDFERNYSLLSNFLLLPALPTGILALAINYGAYMTEVFRAGIQSISKGQSEAARALGMTPSQTMWRIILPQAVRVVIPPVGNDFIAMTKDSALVSVIGVQELLWRAQKVGVQYFHSMETLLIAAGIYWLLTIVLQSIQSRIERHLARGDR
jgi:polar amino acid transport system permease protein